MGRTNRHYLGARWRDPDRRDDKLAFKLTTAETGQRRRFQCPHQSCGKRWLSTVDNGRCPHCHRIIRWGPRPIRTLNMPDVDSMVTVRCLSCKASYEYQARIPPRAPFVYVISEHLTCGSCGGHNLNISYNVSQIRAACKE